MQTVLVERDIRLLLEGMIKHGRPCIVDWTNRNIEILSQEKTNPNVILSDGPMKYRDCLYQSVGRELKVSPDDY